MLKNAHPVVFPSQETLVCTEEKELLCFLYSPLLKEISVPKYLPLNSRELWPECDDCSL